MLVIDMPCDNRCRHRGARSCHRHAHQYALSYVLVAGLSIVLYCRESSRIFVYGRAHRRAPSRSHVVTVTPKYLRTFFSWVCHSRFVRHNWKLEGGHLVEGGNVFTVVAAVIMKERIPLPLGY